jgi:hypothetical protein
MERLMQGLMNMFHLKKIVLIRELVILLIMPVPALEQRLILTALSLK